MKALVVLLSLSLSTLTGCASLMSSEVTPPTDYISRMNDELGQLPPPDKKIPITVYCFPDRTGQYKQYESGSSLSRFVTQGAETMLIDALRNSGWFTVVERQGLSNLVEERKIIRSTRAAHGVKTPLPPLRFASVIIEGGIITYDSSVVNSGLGIKYFGAGGSVQIQSDQVSINIRAVSVQSGEIIESISVSKTIWSQAIDFSIFRFVEFKKLLDAEAGITNNEPAQLCVKEAIDKGVINLVIAGILDGHWKLKDEDNINHPLIQQYKKEKGGQ